MEKKPNCEQSAVIDDFSNHIILYAGAGTGKTFTVAQKVKRILEQNLASPEQILCLTFTLKACDEMRGDIMQDHEEAKRVEVRTIHSFCFQIVKEEAKRASDRYIEPVICDEIDQEEILRSLIPSMAAELALQEELKGKIRLETLYECDVVYLAGAYSLNGCSQSEKSRTKTLSKPGFFWKIPFPEGNRYVSPNGWIDETEANRRRIPLPFSCPECGKRQLQSGNFCCECGFDFRTHIAPMEFALERYGNYRNLVSLIKHCRVMQGIDSGDERKNFQDAFDRLKGSEECSKALSYRNRGFETVDERLLRTMERFAGEILHAYQTLLVGSNRLDFDDLILEARKFLLDPTVCARWREKYKFIIVDEMQDTSELEYDVLSRLFSSARVMMCGDLFQTIYEWRGSRPRIVLKDFFERFHAKPYQLSENFRSTRILTSASFGYLQNAFPEDIGAVCSEKIAISGGTEGEPIPFVRCFYPPEPARAEAEFLFRYLKQHPAELSEICIMARSNRYIGRLWEYFNQLNASLPQSERLSFFTVAQNYRFLKTPVVKDVIALWTLLVNPTDTVALERIAERYIARVGPATLQSVRESARLGLSLGAFLEPDTYAADDPYFPLFHALDLGNIVVYDAETTGLDVGVDEIVQIAAFRLNRSGAVRTFRRFLIPTVQIQAQAQNTHGFSAEFLRAEGIPAASALKEFSDFAEGCVLVGHNSLKFDRAIVNRQLKECGLPPLKVLGEYDTLSLAKLLLPTLKDHKLSTLCEAFHIVNERAHDAFSDVEATGKVLLRLTEEFLEPTREARSRIVRRCKGRFQPFYQAYCSMREPFLADNSDGLKRLISERFCLYDRCERELERDGLDMLFALAHERAETVSLETAVRGLIAEAALAGSEMDVLMRRMNKIPIITVHQAKGCEFDTVLFAGVDNVMFPLSSDGQEEGKRLFYVAISRAKIKLVMSCQMSESAFRARVPSPYVDFIPQEYLKMYSYRKGE